MKSKEEVYSLWLYCAKGHVKGSTDPRSIFWLLNWGLDFNTGQGMLNYKSLPMCTDCTIEQGTMSCKVLGWSGKLLVSEDLDNLALNNCPYLNGIQHSKTIKCLEFKVTQGKGSWQWLTLGLHQCTKPKRRQRCQVFMLLSDLVSKWEDAVNKCSF